MRTSTLLLLSLLIFCVFIASAQAQNNNVSWSQSYQDYRNHIKPLAIGKKQQCEKLLSEILSDLDTKNNCSIDADCSLIDQDPFGATIPVRIKEDNAIKAKMKKYRETCDDGSFHGVKNMETMNLPVCLKTKCMVKTSLKKK